VQCECDLGGLDETFFFSGLLKHADGETILVFDDEQKTESRRLTAPIVSYEQVRKTIQKSFPETFNTDGKWIKTDSSYMADFIDSLRAR
jgi:hypothetical protein